MACGSLSGLQNGMEIPRAGERLRGNRHSDSAPGCQSLTLGSDTGVTREGVALHAVSNKIPHLDTHSSQILTPDPQLMPRRSHFTASDFTLSERGARKRVPCNKSASLTKARAFVMANGMGLPNSPGSGSQVSLTFLAIPPASPGPHGRARAAPAAAANAAAGHEGVKRPPRWPTCFALRRGHAGGCPLPWGGCQGPAALSGAVPQAA